MFAQKRGTPHNYHLAVLNGRLHSPINKSGDGFYEPKTVHKITARAPDKAKGEVFTGWTSRAGMGRFWVRPDYPKHKSTTHPAKSKGRFANAKALTTRFKMPANDIIVTANYQINPKHKAPVAGAAVDGMRVWRDKNGKTLNAKYVATRGDKVVLEAAGGRQVNVRLSALSAEDQAFIGNLPNRRGEKTGGGGPVHK